MTSGAQPKLTPSIYITARDDGANAAYHFFFFESTVFLQSKREEVGYFYYHFINMLHLYTMNILPIMPSECLDESIKKKKLFPVAH